VAYAQRRRLDEAASGEVLAKAPFQI